MVKEKSNEDWYDLGTRIYNAYQKLRKKDANHPLLNLIGFDKEKDSGDPQIKLTEKFLEEYSGMGRHYEKLEIYLGNLENNLEED